MSGAIWVFSLPLHTLLFASTNQGLSYHCTLSSTQAVGIEIVWHNRALSRSISQRERESLSYLEVVCAKH